MADASAHGHNALIRPPYPSSVVPRLPEFLNEVVLRDLRLGNSSVDLRVRRHGEEVSLEVLRTRGQIQVSIVLTH